MTRDKWAHDGKQYLSNLNYSIDKDRSYLLLTRGKAEKIKPLLASNKSSRIFRLL